MACAVLPWERQCRLRVEVVRGTDSLRCDLRHIDQWEHIGHSGSAEERHHLYAVFLQRHRWRRYWRPKLHAARLWHANSNADAYSDGQLHAKFVPRAHRLFRYHRAYAVAERDLGRARRGGG